MWKVLLRHCRFEQWQNGWRFAQTAVFLLTRNFPTARIKRKRLVVPGQTQPRRRQLMKKPEPHKQITSSTVFKRFYSPASS
jgi:hypothetical protein